MAEEEKEQPIIKKVKKVEGGGHHGGAWKVAYADFVTAMMALFIVLWILSASEEVKENISAYFDDPGAFSFVTGKRTIPVESGLSPEPGKKIGDLKGDGMQNNSVNEQLKKLSKDEYRELKDQALKDSIDTAKMLEQLGGYIQDYFEGIIDDYPSLKTALESVEFTYTEDGLKIDLKETEESLFFEIGSSNLKEEGKKVLSVIAKEIGKLPNSVEIQGHTDSQKYKNGNYNNWDLSTDRANSTRKYLELKGFWKGQINEVSGFADKQLLNPENPFSSENRRVTIYVKHVKTEEFLRKELIN